MNEDTARYACEGKEPRPCSRIHVCEQDRAHLLKSDNKARERCVSLQVRVERWRDGGDCQRIQAAPHIYLLGVLCSKQLVRTTNKLGFKTLSPTNGTLLVACIEACLPKEQLSVEGVADLDAGLLDKRSS